MQIESNKLQDKIEVVVFQDGFQATIGEKRNRLLETSTGKFTVFIDDDDDISENYCKKINTIIERKNVDYIGYKLYRSFDDKQQPCEYRSINFKQISRTIDGIGYRTVSHTNPIKSCVSKQFRFEHWKSGEDSEWCQKIHSSNLLKTEHFLNELMYFQSYNSNLSLSKKAKETNDKTLFAKPEIETTEKFIQLHSWPKWIVK
jgi:hypothetical protein